jgi:hypothetical protein
VTAKLPAEPTVKFAEAPLVIAGASSTVSVKFCRVPVLAPFDAWIVSVWAPPVPGAGVPLRTPVTPSPTPLGSAPPITLKLTCVG